VIVVSDTSPLNYLVLTGAIDVLPRLFGEIHVPTQVMDELKRSRAPAPVKQWSNSPPQWLRVSTPSTTITTSVRLDPGETQAIALATELRADTVLIDERKGRRVAEEHGFDAVGTLTVLELAAERKLLDLKPTLEALRHRQSLSYAEIADQMNMTEAAARKLWSRTVESLRQELGATNDIRRSKRA
jgi:predicted nucleic acid-binding protein